MAVSTRTDEEIQKDVLEELKWDTTVRPNEVGVSVKDGIVMLTGWVDSYLKKIHAEEAAHRKKETLGPPNVAGSCKHRDRHQGGGNEKEYLESICVW